MSENPYADILYLPHHQSRRHPHMSNAERAAQFSPFVALSGHGDRIEEAARQSLLQVENEIIHTTMEGDEPWSTEIWETQV